MIDLLGKLSLDESVRSSSTNESVPSHAIIENEEEWNGVSFCKWAEIQYHRQTFCVGEQKLQVCWWHKK